MKKVNFVMQIAIAGALIAIAASQFMNRADVKEAERQALKDELYHLCTDRFKTDTPLTEYKGTTEEYFKEIGKACYQK